MNIVRPLNLDVTTNLIDRSTRSAASTYGKDIVLLLGGTGTHLTFIIYMHMRGSARVSQYSIEENLVNQDKNKCIDVSPLFLIFFRSWQIYRHSLPHRL